MEAAKERKMRERIEQEAGENASPSDSLFTFQNILPVIGIGIAAAALFYELYPRKIELKDEPQHDRAPSASRKDPPVKNTQLESFD